MATVADKAREYERRFPGATTDEAQAAERQERMDHKEDRALHRRTSRTSGIIVPALPWLED